jgi:hypothetical protein
MLRLKRSTFLISVAMISIFVIACGAAEKPATEPDPPTPIPTHVAEPTPASLAEGIPARRDGGATGFTALADPEVQKCLATELGVEIDPGASIFDRSLLASVDPENVTAAFAECGVELPTRGTIGGRGGFTGGAGGFASRVLDDPELRECLTEELGEDALDNLGQGSGFGLTPETLAAMQECGLNFGDGGSGFQFGGREGEGFRGGGGFADGSFQECMTEELGEDALSLLRNPTGEPPAELQDALAKCGGGAIAIPVEPGDGIGDGAGPISVEPAAEPTATPIPVSDLTIEQLTCLSGELDPAALANAVIATSSGDLSALSSDVLAALETCGVGS